MAQAFIKNINGNFSGPATFFRGGGQYQCPPNYYWIQEQIFYFFPSETNAGLGINSSTHKGDRCDAIPPLKGGTNPSQGGELPPLELFPTFSRSIPFILLHFIIFSNINDSSMLGNFELRLCSLQERFEGGGKGLLPPLSYCLRIFR